MDITVQFAIDSATLAALAGLVKPQQPQWATDIIAALQTLGVKVDKIMAAIDDLTAEVTRDTTVIGSAVTLINGFAAQLAAAGTDPAKLAALQATLKTNVDDLAAAVAANTPAA